VYRPLDKHIAVQQDLIELGFLPAGATADGVYGPATRAAIVAWQEAHSQTPTAFLSDAETKLISDAATAHRGQSTSGQLAPTVGSLPSDPYSQGMADWYDLKQWSDAQTGERGFGVQYWEGNRNVPGHASCAEMADKRAAAGVDRAAFLSGCDEAKRRLDPIDDRRRSDPAYKAGFSSGASGAPLQPSNTLGSGTLVSPLSPTRP
jgi:peptidoglycan hydrolase-like protein with peptidoglycan-binding domain